jgi:peptidoglycan/LPS O-acetylase OafA/YrhL
LLLSLGPTQVFKTILTELNGLRGIAILAVILHHLFSEPLGAMHLHVAGVPLAPLVTNGWLGVNLFFVLSGFVLYLPYASGQRQLRGMDDWAAFYRHRALRLFPAYYFVTVAIMALSGRVPFGNANLARETIGLLTFTFPFMSDLHVPPTNWALWSIGAEVLFSTAFPALCLACLRIGPARVLITLIPFAMMLRFIGHYIEGRNHITWIEVLMLGRIDEFLWGFLLADFFARKCIPTRPYLLLIAGVACLVPALAGFSLTSDGRLPTLFDAPLVTLLDIALAFVLAAALAGRSAVASIMNFRPLRVLGMACFSLYLWHFPILIALRLHIDPWDLPNLAAFFIFLGILSALTYRCVEFRSATDWKALFLIGKPNR